MCGAVHILDFGGTGSQRVKLMPLLSSLVTPMAVGIAQGPSAIEGWTRKVLTLWPRL